MKYYHISLPNGSQIGPYDETTLQNMAATGQIPRDCMVWTEGMSNWMPLFQVIHIPKSPPMAPNNPQHPLYTQYQAAMQGDAEAQYYLLVASLMGNMLKRTKPQRFRGCKLPQNKTTIMPAFNWQIAMVKASG